MDLLQDEKGILTRRLHNLNEEHDATQVVPDHLELSTRHFQSKA